MSETLLDDQLVRVTELLLWVTAPFIAASVVFGWAMQESGSLFASGFAAFSVFVSTVMLAVVGYDIVAGDTQ